MGKVRTELVSSNDRKVSPDQRQSPAGDWKPRLANAFGLKSGTTCPGLTKACDGCYAAEAERGLYGKGILGVVENNTRLLFECDGVVEAMADMLRTLIGTFRKDVERAMGRLVKQSLADSESGVSAALVRRTTWEDLAMYRIHWDGDLFSAEYAEAWAIVIRENPDIRFWLYTRSFIPGTNYVGAFEGLDNLSLWLSIDEYNAHHAGAVIAEHPWVRVATLADTFAEGEEVAVAIGVKPGPKCPENAGRVPLVTPIDGDAPLGEGACVTCGLCLFDRAQNVRFSISEK